MNRCMIMYEDNYKNTKSTGIAELDDFLNLIADLDEELELYALGGTAMVLKGIKESTKDIDFITTKDKQVLRNLLIQAGLKEKSSGIPNIWNFEDIRLDFFYDDVQIMGVPLTINWKEDSKLIKQIGKIKLFRLNWLDIIITKIARAENRDYEDMITIIRKENINFESLKKRYYEIAETSLIADYDAKFRHLERSL